MAGQDYKFEGWLGHDESSADGKLVWGEFEPKPWEETDVDIRVTHSGICGTDIHTLRSGWAPTDYPVCVGHEIVGVAVRVGSAAEGGIKVGDRVGVGAQNDSCRGRTAAGPCEDCDAGLYQYCDGMVLTYNSRHVNGGRAMGGHGRYHRCPSRFVVRIPAGLASEAAAPMLCGGITLYSPLRRYGCGPGKRVGIVGVGGLGHYGVVFAKALGAERVVGISRREEKRAEVLSMGADEYIATEEEDGWDEKHKGSLDLIISTVSSSKVPILGYLSLLKREGVLCQVGNPDDGPLPVLAGALIQKRRSIVGSTIGSPDEIREMLQTAVDKGCEFMIETRPMADANQAFLDMEAGKARYRYVLVNPE